MNIPLLVDEFRMSFIVANVKIKVALARPGPVFVVARQKSCFFALLTNLDNWTKNQPRSDTT